VRALSRLKRLLQPFHEHSGLTNNRSFNKTLKPSVGS